MISLVSPPPMDRGVNGIGSGSLRSCTEESDECGSGGATDLDLAS